MDRENDLLEQSANRRNQGAQAASSAERRVRQVRPRTPGEAPSRTAQNAARPRRASAGERPTRSAAQTNASAPRRSTASAPRAAAPSQVQGRTPSQASPRKVRPQENELRTTAPRQAQPRQASPRQVTPRQVSARGTSTRQSVRSAVDGQRSISSRSTSAASGRGNKKNKSGFKKFLLIYCAILAVILIVGLLIFNSFIKKYEDNIEWMEITNNGTKVIVNIIERKTNKNINNNEIYSIVAKKSGFIKKILVDNGTKLIEENNYVNKGDIIISSDIYLNDRRFWT